MCKLGQFIRDHVFDNNEAYSHIFQVENVFKSRDIDKKSPIFSPSCLLCNGEVIIKGSNCVNYVTVCATIKIAHCKNRSLCE
mgnify:FL=1